MFKKHLKNPAINEKKNCGQYYQGYLFSIILTIATIFRELTRNAYLKVFMKVFKKQ